MSAGPRLRNRRSRVVTPVPTNYTSPLIVSGSPTLILPGEEDVKYRSITPTESRLIDNRSTFPVQPNFRAMPLRRNEITVDGAATRSPPPVSSYAHSYYWGIPSCPQLIAGSRTFERYWWNGIGEPVWNEGGHEPRKQMYSITSKRLIELWNMTLLPQLGDIVRPFTAGTDWSVDLVKLGYNRATAVHVAWIGVAESLLTEAQARMIIAGCDTVFLQHGVTEVDTEIRLSQVALTSESTAGDDDTILPESEAPVATFRDPDTILPGSEYLVQPFTSTMGVPITFADRVWAWGTAGLYLRNRTGEIFALTAQHVLSEEKTHQRLPGAEYSDVRLHLDEDDESNLHWHKVIDEKVVYAQFESQKVLKRQQANLRALGRFESAEAIKEMEYLATQEISGLGATLKMEWSEPERRTFGRIYAHPARQHVSNGFESDWGLITITHAIMPNPRNQVNLHQLSFDHKTRIMINQAIPQDHREDGAIRVSGMLSETECGSANFPVFKLGAASGFTVGDATLHSLTSVDGVEGRQFAVASTGELPFSRRGDSGAAVFDRNGRVVGILVRGNRSGDNRWNPKRNNDITYILPFYWIYEEMRGFGVELELL